MSGVSYDVTEKTVRISRKALELNKRAAFNEGLGQNVEQSDVRYVEEAADQLRKELDELDNLLDQQRRAEERKDVIVEEKEVVEEENNSAKRR